MEQYWAIKQSHPGCLLFYRMGDFFELFFDDAVAAAGALDIALTRRGKHEGHDIPMCGVPVVSHENYVARLIRRGFKVAICEQTEDPAQAKKRGPKAVVRREVVRIVTAGTLVEDTLLDARRCNYLAALADAEGALGIAWIDVSTAEFATQALAWAEASTVLAGLEPGELLAPEPLIARENLAKALAPWQERTTVLPASRFDAGAGRRRLQALLGVGALDAFGAFTPAEVAAAGALIDYVELTQKGRLPQIAPPRRVQGGTVMEIDAATRRNLELTETLAGERAGSLIGVLDRTLTGAGARLLRARLAVPSTERSVLDARLNLIQPFFDDADVCEATREILRRCPDAERAMGRLSLGRGGPRDLACVRDALRGAARLVATLTVAPDTAAIALGDAIVALGDHRALVDALDAALADSLPLATRDGGFIAAGYRAELDTLRRLRDDSRRLIAELEARYVQETGLNNLKIRHNNMLGYYVEVPAKQAERLSADAGKRFILRQSMVGAQRYTTVELGELEGRIASAGEEVLAQELALFADLCANVLDRTPEIARTLRALAELDIASALGNLARAQGWVRPVLTDDGGLVIHGGRHPMVEAALATAAAGRFVGNDLTLDAERRLWLLTGPNMAGKSTFLRQNALIVLLAQIGVFVPADAAEIGIVDRLFSRVGAADDLAQGRSTFMVEMIETAAILHQAGPRAFVILDEIGRGTATWDGLSIAWAVVEHLCEINRCRGLFATHYHELTALAAKLPALSCHSMRVKEWRGDVVFLHEVAPGTADRSYGIHVARLAGMPAVAVSRAEEVLHLLEKGEQSSASIRLADDLPLFVAAEQRQRRRRTPSAVEEALRALDPDSLAPREALEALYRLKQQLAEEG